ncbi:hypothetical protein GCM10023192_17570 [Amycolatopsis samaneae]
MVRRRQNEPRVTEGAGAAADMTRSCHNEHTRRGASQSLDASTRHGAADDRAGADARA